ncbi:P-loop containing nucleoside triphosphate hydrolase protein [Globomyces pollinis-pini]|nr:P-loop containing nucleoside triphosphate hydrolase protein [Globomyces pollinis-pini]
MNNHSNQFTSSKPNVLWTDVAGYPQLKKKLEQLIRWPIEHPETYRKLGVKPPSGILLHGPSGCGKTMLVHAIANEIPISFISVKSHQIYSKYLGESERMIRLLFQQANKSKPCIIFLDDIDSIGTRREWSEDGAGGVNERVLSSLLNEMDGVGNRDGIIVIACTNQCQNLDDALTRPGRLDIHLKVSIPTTQDRFDILNHLCKKSNVDLSDDVLQTLVDKTFNFTGADLNALLREAGILAMLESISHPKIQIHHLMKALKGVISENREGWWKY